MNREHEMNVFISSTFKDLIEYRKAAIEVVQRLNCKSTAMEFFGARPDDAETVCDKEISECDIFIGIYAHRYGYVPDNQEKSITQQEYELAKKLGKDCLCFIVKKEYSWPFTSIEMDKYPKLEKFLETVKTDCVVEFFKSPDDFSKKLSTSLGNLITKRKGKTVKEKDKSTRIPLAPTPYIAHPYPLPDHFTGRDSERASLSNWFFNETEPVYVMEAIGGMGKSALSWVWLQRDILDRTVEIDGIFWWSFYDGPFDSFIRHLACYVLGKEDNSMSPDDTTRLSATLQQRRFLLVLDGLERALRGYAGMEAMFIQEKKFEGKPEEEIEWDRKQREPVNPSAERFLKSLVGCKTKTLITTRLMPTPLEDLAGVSHISLKGLSQRDAVRFMRSEGVKGTRTELEQAGKVYDYHPLMLKLLTTSIRRSRAKDIKDAYGLKLIDKKEPHKILSGSFNLLSKEERHVASCVAVFRSAFKFDSAKALFLGMDEESLWQVLQELRSLGFLFYDEDTDCFDFHPIMRSFLYNSLTHRADVHNLAVRYFRAIPGKEKIITLDDLAPVIELYHHLVKAGKFDEAYYIYQGRITIPALYQLSAYHLIIELLKELFPEGEDQLPRLKNEFGQAWTLNELAISYVNSGQPARAVPLFFKDIKITEKKAHKLNIAIPLGNVADYSQLSIGQLSASTGHLRKRILLCREIKDKSNEAIGHQRLGRVLAYQWGASAEDEITIALKLFKQQEYQKWFCKVQAYRSLSAFLQARLTAVLPGQEIHSVSYSREALKQARKALEFVEEMTRKNFPLPRDFVRAYWLLGEALIQCRLSTGNVKMGSFEIHFYDEYFQEQVESMALKKGNELEIAERCINEALRRCRKINLVELEPDILLAQARLEWTKKKHLPDIEKNLKEAMDIALRSGYRLKLADLHLFCGQVLLELKEKGPGKLFNLTAKDHLEKTKEYALDASQFKDLYQSEDPHFYDNIPEYEMLKSGMTHEERIKNGYWIAYRIAEALELRI
jgi:hypothetical protein